jgi:phosphoribosylanthranilate isomerase
VIFLLLFVACFSSSCRLIVIVKRTRIKICGITRPEDASAAVEAGADAIGLVFYAPSSRSVTLDQAREICAHIPPFVTIVALTVNADNALLQEITGSLPVSLLQFHGDETPGHCEAYSVPYIKALRMKDGVDVVAECGRFSSALALLLDAYQPGRPGGTGETFDWDMIPASVRTRIILAGGLTPGNIQQAIQQVSPYAVDVSGGVEASPGIKDVFKINEFIGNASRAIPVE